MRRLLYEEMRCQPEPRVFYVQWSKLDTGRLISAPKVARLMMRTPCLGFRLPISTSSGNYATHLSLKGHGAKEYTIHFGRADYTTYKPNKWDPTPAGGKTCKNDHCEICERDMTPQDAKQRTLLQLQSILHHLRLGYR